MPRFSSARWSPSAARDSSISETVRFIAWAIASTRTGSPETNSIASITALRFSMGPHPFSKNMPVVYHNPARQSSAERQALFKSRANSGASFPENRIAKPSKMYYNNTGYL